MKTRVILTLLMVQLLSACGHVYSQDGQYLPFWDAVAANYRQSLSPGGIQRSFAAGVSHGFGTPTYTDRVETPDGKTTVFRTSCGRVNCKTKVEVED